MLLTDLPVDVLVLIAARIPSIYHRLVMRSMCRKWRSAVDHQMVWRDIDVLRFDDCLALSGKADACYWAIKCRRMKRKRLYQHWKYISRFLTHIESMIVVSGLPKQGSRIPKTPFVDRRMVNQVAGNIVERLTVQTELGYCKCLTPLFHNFGAFLRVIELNLNVSAGWVSRRAHMDLHSHLDALSAGMTECSNLHIFTIYIRGTRTAAVNTVAQLLFCQGSENLKHLSIDLDTHESTMFSMAGHHDEFHGGDAAVHVSATIASALGRFDQLERLELFENHEGINMITFLETAPVIAQFEKMTEFRYFYKSLEVRDPFYTQLSSILNQMLNIEVLINFRDCYCNRTDVKFICDAVRFWGVNWITRLKVIAFYERDAFQNCQNGHDEENFCQKYDEFGQMTREYRLKRETEFFFSQEAGVESSLLIDDHSQIPHKDRIGHLVPQAATVYSIDHIDGRHLSVIILFA